MRAYLDAALVALRHIPIRVNKGPSLHRWRLLIGLAMLADSLVILLSLGTLASGLSLAASRGSTRASFRRLREKASLTAGEM